MRSTTLLFVPLLAIGLPTLPAAPITWGLLNVTFTQGGSVGPIQASGTFTYDADILTMLSWDIVVSNALDPILDFEYTPGSSFIPSLYVSQSQSARFVVTLPGNPPENPSGTSPFGPNSALLDFNFFAGSPGNQGLTNAGGTIEIVAGGTQTYDIPASTGYQVATGAVTTDLAPEPDLRLVSVICLIVGMRQLKVKHTRTH